ncbi:MAG: PLP-dependent aminotransferase family protein [Pseudomonadota bacterium]
MQLEEILASRATRMKASEIRELLKLLDQPDVISFAGGIPDPALFPADAFQQAYADMLTPQNAARALQYSTSAGYLPLREWIVEEMARIDIPCSVDNILITSGSQQALDYLGKLFLSANDTALVTWPTYLGALGAFNAYEPVYDRLDPMANRDDASYKDAAAAMGGRVKFAYASVDFANPTGRTLDLTERDALLDQAERLDIAVIEDAAYQALRYEGEAIPPILARDIQRNGHIDQTRTLYCGSFSKTLTPGLRVGWVCAARPAIERLELIKQGSDLQSPTINQMVMHHVASRIFDTHGAKLREAYREKRDAMLTALERHMPDEIAWTQPQGGMFIWLTLPKTMDGAACLAHAIKTENVAFVPGGAFFADGSGANSLRLNFSLPDLRTIDEGIKRLARALQSAA